MSQLSDAITAVETAQSAFDAGQAVITNDEALSVAAQAKADAAKTQVVTDQSNQLPLKVTLNSALDILIAAATAAKQP